MKHNLCRLHKLHLVFLGESSPPSPQPPPPSPPRSHTHTGVLHSLNPAAPRVSIASPLLGPGRQPSLPVGTLRLERKTHNLIPQHSFRQTLILFTHIHLPRRRRKKGGEKSLLNPNTNTALIHIHVLYLSTCVAYNGRYHSGSCAPGSHDRKSRGIHFLQL